jgi:hypothetical protein
MLSVYSRLRQMSRDIRSGCLIVSHRTPAERISVQQKRIKKARSSDVCASIKKGK